MAWGCPLDDSEILLVPFILYYTTYVHTMRAQLSTADDDPQERPLKFRFGI